MVRTIASAQTLLARDIMNPHVLTVRDDMSIDELSSFLLEEEISGAPVVDAKGRLVGVVSLRDLAEDQNETASANHEAIHASEWHEKLNPEDLALLHVQEAGRLVRDIMTPTVYTIPEDLTVQQIAKTMVAGRIHRLFATRHGSLVGIITALDLLKLLARDPEA